MFSVLCMLPKGEKFIRIFSHIPCVSFPMHLINFFLTIREILKMFSVIQKKCFKLDSKKNMIFTLKQTKKRRKKRKVEEKFVVHFPSAPTTE